MKASADVDRLSLVSHQPYGSALIESVATVSDEIRLCFWVFLF